MSAPFLFQRNGAGEVANPGTLVSLGWGSGWGEMPWGPGIGGTPVVTNDAPLRMSLHEAVPGDTGPVLCQVLANAVPVDLTAITSMEFRLKSRAGVVLTQGIPPGNIVGDPLLAQFFLDQSASWNAVPIHYFAELDVTWSNGITLTYGTGSAYWRVLDDLAV